MVDQRYIDYLKSPEWQRKRAERLRMDGYKCARCGFPRALTVHHINYNNIYHEDVANDLITLCKKCHEKIEDEKRSVGKEHYNVYLAGKIDFNDWRGAFINYRNAGLWWFEDIDARPVESFISQRIAIDESATMTGPYFISCDHGCYHGEGKHGVGAEADEHGYAGCMGQFLERKDVEYISRKQIDAADVVLAYINDPTCYGTLAEIGYARARNKYIIVVYASDELRESMWFVGEMANIVYEKSKGLMGHDNGTHEEQKRPSTRWCNTMVRRLI